jgi:AcrR family transcriptional regulator
MEASPLDKSGRRFKGLSAEERREQRRQQLVDAGIQVFGKLGFHGAGVREICAEAHLTERYFYESFENREALFMAVYEEGVNRLRAAILVAIAAAGTPELATRPALRAYFQTLKDEPRLARIVLQDVLTVGADAGARSVRVTSSFADLIVTLIEAQFPDLAASGIDAKLVANGLVGATLFMAMQWSLGGFREPLERVLDHAVLIYDAVREHTAPPPLEG